MGLDIDRDHFSDEEYVVFDRRLRDCLVALAEVLDRPGFGQGEATIGAELELHLVDSAGRPAPINRKVLAAAVDPRVTLEINRFNLEINTRPVQLAGSPFSALAAELEDALGSIRRAAAAHDAHAVMIGILPTLTERDLASWVMTPMPRYRALAAGIERLRRAPPTVHIQGDDPLSLDCADVALEGANTSFQVHLRVVPATFADMYNAAQIATAPVLAASCNSPLFLGRRLWDETRVALFRQATDDRDDPSENDWRPARVSFGHGWARRGALELFAETVTLHEPLLPVCGSQDPVAVARAGGMPGLPELRLHNGTVWRWNRPVYDDTDGGHLRIELRALPSGPTVADLIANAAWLVGLMLGLSPVTPTLLPGLTFGHARRNFYQAARFGLHAEILWPDRAGERVRPVGAVQLIERLLPLAHQGLLSAGVASEEADRWLPIVVERARRGLTGARWQRRAFEQLIAKMPTPDACAALLGHYMKASDSDTPVHEWPLP
ncbi:MAG: glutamate--cysteine ligase [Gammaproteobacteria bacterium]